MDRRAFLGALIAAPVAAPLTAKAVAFEPPIFTAGDIAFAKYKVSLDPRLGINGVSIDSLVRSSVSQSEFYGREDISNSPTLFRLCKASDGKVFHIEGHLKPGETVSDEEIVATPFEAHRKFTYVRRSWTSQ